MPAKSVTVVTFEADDAAADAAEGDADAPVAGGDEDVFVEEHPKRSSAAITITKLSVIILLFFIFNLLK
ncbi:MAG: hypothetical protein P4L49_04790 [Desulfosporosinus sp.]|nr:hypothetical protein [Desulfosporosinus sp.]